MEKRKADYAIARLPKAGSGLYGVESGFAYASIGEPTIAFRKRRIA